MLYQLSHVRVTAHRAGETLPAETGASQNCSRSWPASKPARRRATPSLACQPARTRRPARPRRQPAGLAAFYPSAPAEGRRGYGRNMPAVEARPGPGAEIAPVAALMGDPARAAMLTALLDDRALAAGELASLAGVSPATASEHLTRLLGGGLVTVVSQSRHR